MINNAEEFIEKFNQVMDGIVESTDSNISELLKFTSDNYYSGKELISDAQYDALVESLRIINPSNPLIAGLAGDEYNSAGYKEVPNGLTMGTLEKCMTIDEGKSWWKKNIKPHEKVHISTKMDGVGELLEFKDGNFVRGTSRGTGFTGFDKTEMIRLLSFPKSGLTVNGTPFTGFIRGEAELSNRNFGLFPDKKNPRNASSGLLNKKFSALKDTDKELISKIDFIAYDIRSEQMPNDTKESRFHYLEHWGFKTPVWSMVDSFEEVETFRNTISKIRGTEDEEYGMDGIVLAKNVYDKDDQQLKVQSNAVAIKFDLLVAKTKVIGIDWSESGRYFTPVAKLSPVSIGGATISRASLCNLRVINEDLNGLKINDEVYVVRRGEVIPKVIGKVK